MKNNINIVTAIVILLGTIIVFHTKSYERNRTEQINVTWGQFMESY